MVTQSLTREQAFAAMVAFLRRYYEELQHPEEIGILLGELQISSDGITVDPAAWSDWLNCVNEILSE